jgi:hypothetical protein
VLSYAYSALAAACVAYLVFDIPIQNTDSYGPLLGVDGRSLSDLLRAQVHEQGFFRPMRWAQIWMVFAVSRGDYFTWFRGWHSAQVVALVGLFVHLLRPRSLPAAAVVPLGLAALFGSHTFAGTVTEAFPINHFMTILLCCLVAAELALGPPSVWRTVAACGVLVYAELTLESGLLVPVVLVAAWAAGARGVTRWGAVAALLLTVGYAYMRVDPLAIGAPGLSERSSGFGFTSLDPDELIARFGTNPWPFYAYNVGTSFLSVLLAEPRAGTWNFVGHLRGDGVSLVEVASVLGSTLGTIVIGCYIWARRAAWRAGALDRGDRLVAIFVAMAVANAVLSYAYTKDVILSPAGMFFALALAVAVTHLVASAPPAWTVRTVTIAAAVLLLSAAWAVRAVGLHVALHTAGTQVRDEWAYIESEEHARLVPVNPSAARMRETLETDAIWRHPGRPVSIPFSHWLDD